ncbi:sensor histidine kinase [Paenibacillus sp. J5C_2022]|uniref:sensor histidine kinase n=1 Tax=Paenibacillus sp. J5C2022 TaxID=2977129 RepID=UPI0021D1DA6F|nr:sensor histidine kinase [Paenibacillus sp. J5C2022]MCU6709913.1 sensor histidine kinase [Paenibacillus sp. J5C2022]
MLKSNMIKRFQQTSFRTKLIVTYLLLIAVPVMSALFINGAHLYRQTNSDYEDILQQLDSRTNVTVNDFFNNLSRNSFFYLTEHKLYNIMDKSMPSTENQYIKDANYMQTALEQLVLINGNIATISVAAPNGSIYGSKPENAHSVLETVGYIGKEQLQKGSFVVSVPGNYGQSLSLSHNQKQFISIVRYLSDLNLNKGREAYVKIEIYAKAIENMLGGISTQGQLKLQTIVLDGNTIVYHSEGRPNMIDPELVGQLTSSLSRLDLTTGSTKVSRLEWNDQHYMVGGSINKVTGWTIIHFIPDAQIVNTFIGHSFNYVLFSLLALAAAFSLAYFFHRYFINPILKLSGAMKTIDSGHLHHVAAYSEREDEIGRLINSFNDMINRLRRSRESEIAAGMLQKKSELKMLQAQINPHFLYNTLNTIHAISELHRMEDISTMTKCLSSLYRYNIKYGDEVTIANELEQIDNYVKIQQIRFYNRFQVEYRIDPEVMPCKILKFLIQPIIENSFYHGLEPKVGRGTLSLTIKRVGQSLYIFVHDDGVGIHPDKLEELNEMLRQDQPLDGSDNGRNYGLMNVYTRIKHFYGDGYWMKVRSNQQDGTTITLTIPIVKGDATK